MFFLPPRVRLLVLAAASLLARPLAAGHRTLPSYHYGAPIQVECMNRSS